MVGLRAPGISGGIEQVVGELGGRLVARGHAVTAYCRRGYNVHGRTFRGIDLVDLPTVGTRHLEAITHTALAIPHAMAGGFDLIHVHAVGPALLSFLPRLAGVPTVVTVHGLDWRRDKWAPPAKLALKLGSLCAMRSAHVVIAVSRDVERYLDSPHVVYVPNGVAQIAFAPLKAAKVADLRPGYFLYLGRIVPEKAIEVILAAHRMSGTDAKLVITGGSGYADAYMDRLRRMAGPGVVFTGERLGHAKAALIHHARAVLLPSRLEGLPLGLLEAMGAGRPVIASNIPAHVEISRDSADLVPVDDIDAWTHRLANFDSELAMVRARKAQQAVLQRFSWDDVVDETAHVYEAALASAGRLGVHSRC